jgi:hypothetical protein
MLPKTHFRRMRILSPETCCNIGVQQPDEVSQVISLAEAKKNYCR